MNERVPSEFALIAGRGAYPRILLQEARQQGVQRVFAVAFRKQTHRAIEQLADEVRWVDMGQVGRMIDVLKASGMRHAVMAGQITPALLFRLRPDAWALRILRRLPVKNAHTVFGAVVQELQAIGMHVLPASTFMAAHMPQPGVLTRRAPTAAERRDIDLGLHVAAVTSGLDIGQTVVVKQGVVLAVEAFEGTDQTILRAGRLGGAGTVVVKAAKAGHDMRFDIPLVGRQTLRVLKRAGAAVLALEAGRTIVLERDRVVAGADAMGISLLAVKAGTDAP